MVSRARQGRSGDGGDEREGREGGRREDVYQGRAAGWEIVSWQFHS